VGALTHTSLRTRSDVQYVMDASCTGPRTPYNAAIHGYPVAAVMAPPVAVQMNPLVVAVPTPETKAAA
jgi:hypothetical protein